MRLVVVVYTPFSGDDRVLAHTLNVTTEEDLILLVSVVPGVESAEYPLLGEAVEPERAVEEVNRAVRRMSRRGASVWGVVLVGTPHEQVVGLAHTMGADLIVVGDPVDTKIGRFTMGSLASAIAKHANVPVLVIR